MANTTITPTVGAITLAGVAATLVLAITPVISWERQGESATVTWPAMTAVSVGSMTPNGASGPQRIGYYQASLQASGTWGAGGSVKLQGSNDGANWWDLTPAALTSAGGFAGLGASERPKYIRPNVTAGDATTNITITAWYN